MNVVDLIKEHEGVRLYPYVCPAGFVTLGAGRNIETRGISEDESDYMLANDIRQCRGWLTATYSWFTALDEVRQAAMVDLIYNLGADGLAKFVKFLAAMGRSDWPKAGAELKNSDWFGQVGRRGPRVISMIERGLWPE